MFVKCLKCYGIFHFKCNVRDFGVARGQILGFSIDLRRRHYNTLELPCECAIHNLMQSANAMFVDARYLQTTAQKNNTFRDRSVTVHSEYSGSVSCIIEVAIPGLDM